MEIVMLQRRPVLWLVMSCALLGLLLAVSWRTAQATVFTLTVDRLDDTPAAKACTVEAPDDCSLRGALSRAAADPDNSYLIELAAGATYEVNKIASGVTGLPPIAGTVIIDGRGATITRGSELIFRLFDVADGGELALNRVTLSAGNAGSCETCDGGALLVDSGGAAIVHETAFFENAAGAGGGALYVNFGGTSTVSASTFEFNHAGSGGAIHSNGLVTVENSTFAAN